jgi:alpha-galactosidase
MFSRTPTDYRLLLATLIAGYLIVSGFGRPHSLSAEEPTGSRKEAAAVLQRFLDKGNAPVSFVYGGRPSQELLPSWKVTSSSKEEGDRTLHTVTYADPASGLELIAEICEYKDFPAVEWVLHFKNAGEVDTPILENVQALDLTLDVQPGYGEVVLHRVLGCAGSCSTASISDFAPVDEVLPLGVKSRVASVGGRSATSAMPFFNLEIPENRGVVVAIGWTGQWAAEFERPYFDKRSILTVKAGMERTHLKLLPGEQIRTPRSLLLFWEGEWIDGQNQFRRFVLRHKTPQVDGKPVQLPVAGMGWFLAGMGEGYTEANQIALAQMYKKSGLPIETFWVDAGWFEGGWPKGVGNWFPKKEAFPNGFKKLSEVVHGLDMNFLVWFEPERVSAGTWLHREHPEWLLSHAKGGWDFMHADLQGVDQYLLNLGNPEARKWITDHVSKLIEESKIDIYRHDANIDPSNYWAEADAPDRQGITEIRHIEGLYAYWEDLKARHPGLIVECCSSGNRRFDLETISRTVNLWRSDFTFRPAADQCQMHGISRFIQLSANGCKAVDKYGFRSVLGPGMCLGWDPQANDFPAEQARENIALFKRLRPYFSGDYYPLTPYSTKENVWLAYQFDRGDLREGVIFAFRRPSCPLNELVVKMGGALPDAEYEIENVDSGKKTLYKGAELIASGLRITAESQPEAVVLIYRRTK